MVACIQEGGCIGYTLAVLTEGMPIGGFVRLTRSIEMGNVLSS
jgi:hypothetical protein